MKLIYIMQSKNIILFALLLFSAVVFSQTKVGGYIKDEDGQPIPFVNVYFKNTTIGVISNEDGRFYLESKNNEEILVISSMGFASQEIKLQKRVTFNMDVVLQKGEQLREVTVYTGKLSKKNNPAIDILRKIWERRKMNGLNMVDQYSYDKYEKVEFDLNTIDSASINGKFFKGLEFMFDYLDTNRVTGKTYIPFFINEISSKVYGDNKLNKKREA